MDPKMIEKGARQAVENCIKLKNGERVVIITDEETQSLARAIEKVAREHTDKVNFFKMEDFGERSLDGSSPLKFPNEIEDAMMQTDVSFFIAQGKPGELQSFRKPMTAVVEKKKIRHAHMIGFRERMMAEGMASDYKQIQEVSRKVFDMVKDAKQIRVTTPAGSDFTAAFSPDRRWVISDGNITREKWNNLPDGEVFTAPIDVNGHVVIDGTLGDFFCEKYGDLSKTPVEFDLKNGRAVKGSVRCSNSGLLSEFEKYVFGDVENSDRVGEFAIGTNIGLKQLIGNLLQDEKFPGIHIALGDSYAHMTGADWTSKTHVDGVMKSATIIVDNKPIMKDGQFLI